MKNLRSLVAPIAVLIITLGVAIPMYGAIQEERQYLAFSGVMEADLLNNQESSRIMENNAAHVDYLLKHPRQTLKACLQYEIDNPEDARWELILLLGGMAYQKIEDEKLVTDGVSLIRSLKEQNPELYDVLMKKDML